MASSFSPLRLLLLLLLGLLAASASASDFNDVQIMWGGGRGKIHRNGRLLTLSLDKTSGSGFQSKKEYHFGKFQVRLKLIPGNSAGTVTTFYLKSPDSSKWDELDFEFLGNLTGHPYTVHTNVFTQGKGDREQQFRLWFDPTKHFHTYSILWNPRRIIFSVDGIPIRQFDNLESKGVPYPNTQPMRLYSTLWNADDWATQGGRVKTDWSQAPFTASYRNLQLDGCVPSPAAACSTISAGGGIGWMNEEMDSSMQRRLRWVHKNYMIYNYCTDLKRFPQGLPRECSLHT